MNQSMKTRENMRTVFPEKHVVHLNVLRLTALLICLPALALSGCKKKQISSTEGISLLAKYHYDSQQKTAYIKSQYEKDRLIEVSDADFKELFSRYDVASVEVNTWLEDVKVGIETGKLPPNLQPDSTQSAETVKAVQAFQVHVNKIVNTGPSNTSQAKMKINDAQDATEYLIRVGRSIWQDYRKMDFNRKEAIKKRLDALKWKPWKDL